MKKVYLVLGLALFTMACSNNTTNDDSMNQMEMEETSTTDNLNPNAKTDPICDMTEGDIAYTDYSVYQQDTVWFCSPHCKEQFDKDPAKYVKE